MSKYATCLVGSKHMVGKILLTQALQDPPIIENLLGVISIGDKGESWPNGLRAFQNRGLPVLRLEFADYDPEKFLYDQERAKEDPPTREHIQQIIDFSEQILYDERSSDGTVLVHCNAGQSRSPAAANIFYAIRYGRGKEHKAYEVAVNSCIRHPWPSNEMLRIASEILGRDLLTPAKPRYEWLLNRASKGKFEADKIGLPTHG